MFIGKRMCERIKVRSKRRKIIEMAASYQCIKIINRLVWFEMCKYEFVLIEKLLCIVKLNIVFL